MTVLVTGFGPFGDQTDNPSALAVQSLAEHWAPADGPRLVVEVLPVSFARAGARVTELIATHRPSLVLGVGVAAGRQRLGLERVAVNLVDARIADVDGHQPVDVPVLPGEPAALFTSLPVKACLHALQDAGLPAELSLTAGTYVCNALMFAALAAAPTGTRAGFLHVPDADVVPVAEVARALRIILKTSLATRVDARVPGGTEH